MVSALQLIANHAYAHARAYWFARSNREGKPVERWEMANAVGYQQEAALLSLAERGMRGVE